MLCKDFNVQVCILFPQKRGMKISPSKNQWNARMALTSCNSTWYFEVPEPMKD